MQSVDEAFEKLKHVVAKNKVPREPPSSFETKGLSMSVQRSVVSDLTDRNFDEGEGHFEIPPGSELFGDSFESGSSDTIDIIVSKLDINKALCID